MQPPFVVQTLIENSMLTQLNLIPVWVAADCLFAMKKFFCASHYLSPQQQWMKDILLSNNVNLSALATTGIDISYLLDYSFYLPSYPSRVLCDDYANKCADFIRIANNPLLVPQCDSSFQTGENLNVSFFPRRNQTVFFLDFMNYSLPFSTTPNTLDKAKDISKYSPSCPSGFVVPDHPKDPGNSWIPGTGCAIGCRYDIYLFLGFFFNV